MVIDSVKLKVYHNVIIHCEDFKAEMDLFFPEVSINIELDGPFHGDDSKRDFKLKDLCWIDVIRIPPEIYWNIVRWGKRKNESINRMLDICKQATNRIVKERNKIQQNNY